ncbi:MAG: GIY-YIG nuclease family protein [Candidatus Kaiserbacteria bacterium]|nr:GIY-YIG nuclease family protein [Candidatus Kaiserbacteria bacterium]
MTRKELSKFKLPDSPGVYFFKSGKRILYIGKATSLRDRVRSYFSTGLGDARSSVIVAMIEEAKSISWKKTDSVLEALILEANLIKQHQPKYNTDEKDDKSYNYLVITKEDFPRVLIVRGRELFKLPATSYKPQAIFGPFPHGLQLKEALKIVRKIFPFRDKCIPCVISKDSLYAYSRELAYKEKGLKSKSGCSPCFNRQIGLCPGVCSGEMSKSEYARTIRHIKTLFSGKIKTLKRTLEKEMRAESKAEHYEKAQELRRQISALEHIHDVSLIKSDNMNDLPARRSLGAGGRSRSLRIEAYDVAHTGGAETVAVMTVVNNGEPEKESYRKFKIKTAGNDDVGALKEVLSRRLAHSEWPLPRVFVVDGSTAQLRAATNMLKDAGIAIPVVAVVKNEFHKPERLIGDAKAISAYEKDILLANQEAHRFAISYHRKRRHRQTLLR